LIWGQSRDIGRRHAITWPYLSYSSFGGAAVAPDSGLYVHEGARWIHGTFFMIAGQTILLISLAS